MSEIIGQIEGVSQWLRYGVLGIFLIEVMIAAVIVLLRPRLWTERAHAGLVEGIGFFVLGATSFIAGLTLFLAGGEAFFDDFVDGYGAPVAVLLILLLAAYQILSVAPEQWARMRQWLVVLIAPLFVLFAVMAGVILGRILI